MESYKWLVMSNLCSTMPPAHGGDSRNISRPDFAASMNKARRDGRRGIVRAKGFLLEEITDFSFPKKRRPR